MDNYAQCMICGDGQLLPFFSREGEVVYFCTRCRTRFSGYNVEPADEGEPILLDRAVYTETEDDSKPDLGLYNSYRKILEEMPPE